MRRFGFTVFLAAASLLAAPAGAVAPSYLLFESGPVRPLALSPDQTKLFAVDTPDNHLEIFSIDGAGALTHTGTVQVGLEPVAVAARTNDEVWVVNHLSDSVSIVRLTPTPHVERTLHVGDEPQDLVFAGTTDGGGFFKRGFITAAHRGQNHTRGTGHTDPLGQFASAGVGRADVWVFDATSLGSDLGGTPLAVIGLFGDKPRALAVNPAGTVVYAAVFHSGNQTTTLAEGLVCNTDAAHITAGTVQPSCINGASEPGAGGIPLPHKNQSPDSKTRPETGLIVQFGRSLPAPTSSHWRDELGRNWDASVRFNLPDRDVFEIDADAATPAAVDGLATCANGLGCWASVGTILFNMVVNPNGKIYVSNTDARNQTRFEGPGTVASAVKPAGEPPTVQGNLAQSRVTVLGGSNVDVRHLNKHLNYAVLDAPAADKAKSLATPTAMAIDGSTLYVAAFGSQKIGVFSTTEIENNTFTPSASNHINLSGGGPAGLVVRGSRLYVLTRFDNSIAVVNPATKLEVQKVALHTPEPADVIDGRPFLYDAQLTSSNGEASCSSCHIFGDMDDLAWDLGNPDDNQVANSNPFNPVIPVAFDPLPRVFHPMKGPMTTQSLRGLVFQGPEHWRGDRQSNGDAVINETDSTLAFEAFNAAFDGLIGRTGQISAADMTAFRKFAMALAYPPNPMRQLNNLTRTGDETDGAALFTSPFPTDTVTNCNGCHTLNPASAFFGSNGQTTFEGETQHVKVPHLRNQYQKVGMFGIANPGTTSLAFDGPFTHQGNQIRGFGFLHDGTVDTLFRFHSASLFSLDAAQQTDLEAFMMVFDSDLAPIVGQQATLTSTNSAAEGPRVDLLKARAQTNFTSKLLGGLVKECDLVAKVVESGVQRGFLFDPATLLFDPDDGGAGITDTALRNKALIDGNPVTFTCAPPGSGHRMALDRDEDVLLDGVETGTGVFVDAQDTGSNPALADTDGDGFDDGVEVQLGFDPNDPGSNPNAGGPPAVPALGPFGLGALAGLLGLGAGASLRRARRRV